MNKTMGVMAAIMLLVMSVGASALTITIPTTGPTLSPPPANVSLKDFSTTYANTAGSGYEYGFEGDVITFNANVLVGSTYTPSAAIVQARLECLGINYTIAMPSTGGAAVLIPGQGYVAPFRGTWTIPSATLVSGNCRVSAVATVNGGVGSSDLASYAAGNDVLANPAITLTADNVYYNVTKRGELNYAVPATQNIAVMSTVDREGQGVKGQLKRIVGQLCTAGGYCLGPQYQYIGIGSGGLGPVSGVDGVAFNLPVDLSPSASVAARWALLFPSDAPSEAYTSSGDNYQLVIQ